MAEPTADRRFACGYCGVDGYTLHKSSCAMRDYGAKYLPGRNATGVCNECGAERSQEHTRECKFFFRMACCGYAPVNGHASWCDYKSPRNPMCDGCGAVRQPDGSPLVHAEKCPSIEGVKKALEKVPDIDYGQELVILFKPAGPLPEREAVDAFFEWMDEQDERFETMRRTANGPNSNESTRAYHGDQVMREVRKAFQKIFVSEVPW